MLLSTPALKRNVRRHCYLAGGSMWVCGRFIDEYFHVDLKDKIKVHITEKEVEDSIPVWIARHEGDGWSEVFWAKTRDGLRDILRRPYAGHYADLYAPLEKLVWKLATRRPRKVWVHVEIV